MLFFLFFAFLLVATRTWFQNKNNKNFPALKTTVSVTLTLISLTHPALSYSQRFLGRAKFRRVHTLLFSKGVCSGT